MARWVGVGTQHRVGGIRTRDLAIASLPLYFMAMVYLSNFTSSLPGQFFAVCHLWVGLSFAEVPASYLLSCRCTSELHVLNDEYTRQWHLPMHINRQDNSSVVVNVLIVRQFADMVQRCRSVDSDWSGWCDVWVVLDVSENKTKRRRRRAVDLVSSSTQTTPSLGRQQ